MRTVFPSDELPHVWANCRTFPAHGRSPSALSFSGVALYSYSTEIALRVNPNTPQEFVLFNKTSYSVTTSRHQGQASCAIPSGVPVFNVYGKTQGRVLSELFDHRGKIPARTARDLVEKSAFEAAAAFTKATRARSEYSATFHRERGMEFLANANAIGARFLRKFQPLTPEDCGARAEAFQKKRTAAQRREYLARQKRYEAERAEREARARERLTLWQAGETVDTYWIRELPVALRLARDADGRLVVETSHGARVLLCQALRLFRFVCALKERGEVYSADGSQSHPVRSEPVRVGPYELRSITANGDAQVGCHSLPFAEMERLHASLTPEQLSEARSERAEVVA